MQKKIYTALALIAVFVCFSLPYVAQAQTCSLTVPCPPGSGLTCGPAGTCIASGGGGGQACSLTVPCPSGQGLTCGPAGTCISSGGGGGVTCGTTTCAPGQTCGTGNICTGTPTGGAGTGLTNPLNNITDLPSLLNAVLGAVVTLGGIFLTLMLIFVGFKFVAAQGNAEELKSARSMLIWTIIGGLILLGAKSIELVIQNTVSGL